MNKIFIFLSFLVLLTANNSVVAQADSSKPKPQESTETPIPVVTKPAESGVSTPQGNFTVPPIFTPLQTAPRPRRKRVDSLALKVINNDNARLAFVKDSLSKLSTVGLPQPANNNPQLITNNSLDTTPVLSQSDNPFDVLRGAASVENKQTVPTNEIVVSPYLEKKTYNKNFNFWVFFFNLLIMAVLMSYGRRSVSAAYNSVTSENILKQSFRDFLSKSVVKVTINGLYLIFLLSLSIYLFLILKEKNTSLPYGQGTLFFYCCAVVFAVFTIKHFILYCISNIFPIKKEVQLYNFVILITGILTGFCLFAINLSIAFGPKNAASFFINCGIFILVIMYLIRYVRSASIIGKFLIENRFHFLLYICSVEIAPVVIFFKILSKYNFGL